MGQVVFHTNDANPTVDSEYWGFIWLSLTCGRCKITYRQWGTSQDCARVSVHKAQGTFSSKPCRLVGVAQSTYVHRKRVWMNSRVYPCAYQWGHKKQLHARLVIHFSCKNQRTREQMLVLGILFALAVLGETYVRDSEVGNRLTQFIRQSHFLPVPPPTCPYFGSQTSPVVLFFLSDSTTCPN